MRKYLKDVFSFIFHLGVSSKLFVDVVKREDKNSKLSALQILIIELKVRCFSRLSCLGLALVPEVSSNLVVLFTSNVLST